MADDTTSTTEPTQDAPEKDATTDGQPPRDELPPEVRRALTKANKEAETLRLKLKEYEDRDKTEQQRIIERAEAAERELAQTRTDVTRARVALAKGVPTDLADRLRGDTEDEMSEDADRLLALLKPQAPRGDVAQGPREQAVALNGDPLLQSLKAKLNIP